MKTNIAKLILADLSPVDNEFQEIFAYFIEGHSNEINDFCNSSVRLKNKVATVFNLICELEIDIATQIFIDNFSKNEKE